MAAVSTVLGDLGEDQLEYRMTTEDCGDTIVVAHEWVYKGTEHAAHTGKIVRRDAWVTIKRGVVASAAAKL
jgi:hypothetical protein